MQPLARMGPDPTTGTCKHDHEPTRTDHGPIRPDPAVDRGGHPPAMGPPAIQTSRTVVTTGRAEWPSTDIGVLSVGPPPPKTIDRPVAEIEQPTKTKKNATKKNTAQNIKSKKVKTCLKRVKMSQCGRGMGWSQNGLINFHMFHINARNLNELTNKYDL